MDDIVKRLRSDDIPETWRAEVVALCRDAADEIERLRAEINGLVSASEAWGRVPKLEAEIERLRAKIADLTQRLHWANEEMLRRG